MKKQSRAIKKTVDRCPHVNRKYYAKGMCNLCYLSFGRNTLATKCPHTDKMNYALNMCLRCYHRNKHSFKHLRASNKVKKAFHSQFLLDANIDSLDIFSKMTKRDPLMRYSSSKKMDPHDNIFHEMMKITID